MNMTDWIVAVSTAIIAVCTVIATVTGFEFYRGITRRTRRRTEKIKHAICTDIENTLRHFKGNYDKIEEKINKYAESRDIKDSVFFVFVPTPTLQKLLEENADILKENQVEKITDLNDLLTALEVMVADSKSRAFAELSGEKRLEFYTSIKKLLQELISAGEEAIKCFNHEAPE